MRGSIVQRPKGFGKYYVVLDLERDPGTGRRRQKWHSGHTTKREAKRALAGLLAARYDGSYVEPSRLTLAALLRERWLPTAPPPSGPRRSTATAATSSATWSRGSARCRCRASRRAG